MLYLYILNTCVLLGCECMCLCDTELFVVGVNRGILPPINLIDDIHYSRICVIYVSHLCAVGFCITPAGIFLGGGGQRGHFAPPENGFAPPELSSMIKYSV